MIRKRLAISLMASWYTCVYICNHFAKWDIQPLVLLILKLTFVNILVLHLATFGCKSGNASNADSLTNSSNSSTVGFCEECPLFGRFTILFWERLLNETLEIWTTSFFEIIHTCQINASLCWWVSRTIQKLYQNLICCCFIARRLTSGFSRHKMRSNFLLFILYAALISFWFSRQYRSR